MLKELRSQLDTGKVTSVQLTEQYLKRIEEHNTTLNAYIHIAAEQALQAAAEADAIIAAGKQTAVTGIPYAAKDIYCTRDIPSTAASKILTGYKPPYNATAINKVAGAVLLGKTNTDEFAMGASTENSCYGPSMNPHDPSRVAGGSSGGSASAVAADLAAFAFGSDTGGSIRQPASFCELVGLRPTYGRVSRYGVMPMASSFDTVCAVTKTVEDTACLLEIIAGQDVHDSTTSSQPVPSYTAKLEEPVEGLRIGVAKEYLDADGLDPAVRASVIQTIEALEKQGAQIVEVSLPHTQYAVPTYYILVPSEVSSNLARFDGIRFGYRADGADDLLSVYMKSRGEGFGAEAKRRIMIGTYALSAGYYDAYYTKAMKVRTLIRQDFTQAFDQVDVLLTPTCPSTAFTPGSKSDPIQMYLEDIFLAGPSLAGLPAVSVPAQRVHQLPSGVQIIGPQWSEELVLRVARMVECLPRS